MEISLYQRDERIHALWLTVLLVHEMKDTPVLWKLTPLYLDAVRDFLFIQQPERTPVIDDAVMLSSFLGISVDGTGTATALLIGQQANYPVIKSDSTFGPV